MEIEEFYQIKYNSGKRIVKELGAPINFNLILTKQCNSNCVHCCASANDTGEKFSLENLKKIIKIAERNNVFYFVLTGGEPLVYEHFWDLLEELNGKFGIVINTNATLIDKKTARRLSKYNIANVHVSLDAPNQEIYVLQRGLKTKLIEVIEGIKNLLEEEISVTTKLIITNINKDYIEDVIKLSISLGVKRINLAWFKSVGRGQENEGSLLINKKDIPELMKRLFELKEKYKGEIFVSLDNAQCFPFLLKKTDKINYKKLCGDYFCRIDYNGDVFPCPFLEIKIGNVFKEDLKDIWKNRKLVQLRELSWGKKLGGYCKKCEYNNICAGGCRARALTDLKDICAKDPLCWMEDE